MTFQIAIWKKKNVTLQMYGMHYSHTSRTMFWILAEVLAIFPHCPLGDTDFMQLVMPQHGYLVCYR